MFSIIPKVFNAKFEDPVLECPYCQEGSGLHLRTVDCFMNPEDRPGAVHACCDVDVDLPGVSVDANMEGNPSRRRGGLILTFFCEFCKHHPELVLAQHKGMTRFYFKVQPEALEAASG